MSIWEKNVPGKYKGPEAYENLACLKNSQEASMREVGWEWRRLAGDEVREVRGGKTMQ